MRKVGWVGTRQGWKRILHRLRLFLSPLTSRSPVDGRAEDRHNCRFYRIWAAKNAPYFEVVTALAVRSPQVLLRQNGVKQTITCPFESYHSSPGGEGTFVVNASQLKEAGLPQIKSGFVACCSHNACAGRDRLDLLQGMLDKGWLDVADLTNPDFYPPNFKPEPVAAEEGSDSAGGGEDAAIQYRLRDGTYCWYTKPTLTISSMLDRDLDFCEWALKNCPITEVYSAAARSWA